MNVNELRRRVEVLEKGFRNLHRTDEGMPWSRVIVLMKQVLAKMDVLEAVFASRPRPSWWQRLLRRRTCS